MISKERNNTPLFHPYELGFCGFSNSGKTTLITSLLNTFGKELSLGYVKHDVHRFQMDKEGKDTSKAWSSGASHVFITDSKHTAHIHRGTPNILEMQTKLLDCDVVFLEGYKKSEVDKIVVVDKDHKIFDLIKTGEIKRVKAFVGIDKSLSNLPTQAPYFQRDNIAQIAKWIKDYFSSKVAKIPVHGLVLAGGQSKRMQTDKALLDYHNCPQVEHVYNILNSICDSTYVSCRQGQWRSADRLADLPQIYDCFQGMGPMGGILSAMQAHPGAAWLVVACDLPFLDKESIQYLISHRNPYRFASCFKSSTSEFPEPLCAIYEPKIKMRLLQYLALGYRCPRKVLINTPTQVLKQIKENALNNINFKDEYNEARRLIHSGDAFV